MSPLNKFFTYLRNSALVKIFFIGFLVLILLTPLFMIQGQIYEREERYRDAVREVSSKWGEQQTIIGPILTVPYKQVDPYNSRNVYTYQAYFLPEKSGNKGSLAPKILSRGIFDIILYELDLDIEADFSTPNFDELKISSKDVLWEDAYITIAIPDMRGIKEDLKFKWNDQELSFVPSSNMPSGLPRDLRSGIQGKIPNLAQGDESFHFSFSSELNGSESLFFVPLGKESTASLSSTWSSPSFDGAFLPTNREINAEGFSADWEISYFSRSYAQQWTNADNVINDLPYAFEESSYGVELLMPVDYYQKNTRSVKYGILFILLTFTVFFLFEVINKLRIHPIQYLFVGFSMCIFYLLLLAFSEHIDFQLAYIIASLSTIALITTYCIKILQTKSRGLIMGLTMIIIYSFLYILLQQEDYALLIGSISLFLFLALVMYLTRNTDWYLVKKEDEN